MKRGPPRCSTVTTPTGGTRPGPADIRTLVIGPDCATTTHSNIISGFIALLTLAGWTLLILSPNLLAVYIVLQLD